MRERHVMAGNRMLAAAPLGWIGLRGSFGTAVGCLLPAPLVAVVLIIAILLTHRSGIVVALENFNLKKEC